MTRPTIRHVLLDADGVLQTIPGGGQAGRARPFLGEDAGDQVVELLEEEQPALRGRADFLLILQEWLRRNDVAVDLPTFYRELWEAIEVSAEMVDLVRRLRTAGYGVHLGTNQHRQRASLMRTELGYDDLFDVSCYSWELGAAKPESAYFERAAALIGAEPAEILFVDDLLRNVEGARAMGLAAEHWDLSRGMPALLDLLSAHGVTADQHS